MLVLGIDDTQGLLYEGTGIYGAHALWPAPIITPAKIVFSSDEALKAEQSSDSITNAWRFREDFFDPISRVRRGRFYSAGTSQPQQWHVQPHPARPFQKSRDGEELQTKNLYTFYGNPIGHKFAESKQDQPIVLLGLNERYTSWAVIGIEAISTGEDLVTLKAHSNLGILPKVDYSKIGSGQEAVVRESLEALLDDVHRAAPASVIDRTRDLASQILLSYFIPTGGQAKDLGGMIPLLEEEKMIIAASAAKIIARLHARVKPVEKLKRELPKIRVQDADLAVQCVGTILRELGWAEWA